MTCKKKRRRLKTATKKVAGSIDAITHKIDTTEHVMLHPLSDLHVGDAGADMELIRAMIDDIKNDENAYTILAGDLMNAAITSSKSDSYAETMTIQEELDTCVELFQPIAQKILAVVTGNHEERISRAVGMDVTKIFCDRLGISDRYRAASALVILKIGQQRYMKAIPRPIFYSIFVNHGHGGGRRVGGKLSGLADLSSIIDADIIIQGHTHVAAMFRQSQYRISAQTCTATPHEQIMLNLPSALKYGGYGMRGGYQPASNRYPVVVLSHDEHKIDVTM